LNKTRWFCVYCNCCTQWDQYFL